MDESIWHFKTHLTLEVDYTMSLLIHLLLQYCKALTKSSLNDYAVYETTAFEKFSSAGIYDHLFVKRKIPDKMCSMCSFIISCP